MGVVTIRPGTPADAAHIAAIHVASWQAAFRGILPDHVLDAMLPDDRLPVWTRILTDPASPMTVIVAKDDGMIAGFASVGPSEDGVENKMTLSTLYLAPAATGKGIGHALLAEGERVMVESGARFATLRVITANAHARRFYERTGWIADPDSIRMEDAWGQQVETIRYTKAFA